MSRLIKNKEYFENSGKISEEIGREISSGLELLKTIKKPIVTFFGSHSASRENSLYNHAYQVANKLGTEGFAVMTGGGTGFMAAANQGAIDAGSSSIGLQASLINGEAGNGDSFTDTYSFQFLFARRFLLAIKSEALVFYPGGYGTLNELFEYLVLMQTGIVDPVPVVCVGKDFWRGITEWLRSEPLKEHYFSLAKDLNLFTVVDDVDQVIALVKES